MNDHYPRYGDDICELTGHCNCFDNGDVCCYCGQASDDPDDDWDDDFDDDDFDDDEPWGV